MILPDVNVLLAAHREELATHSQVRSWLESALGGDELVGIPDFVLMSTYRIATQPKAYATPSTPEVALSFIADVRSAPRYVPITPGERSWSRFRELIKTHSIVGHTATDAMLAALCHEHGCTLYTFDRSFRRFKGLRVRSPLAG